MNMVDSGLLDAIAARREGRNEDALRRLIAWFDQGGNDSGSGRQFGIAMFEWGRLLEVHDPARAALVSMRDEQVRRLLGGDEHFGAGNEVGSTSRFQVIVEMNGTLDDGRATYTTFVQWEAAYPAKAHRRAFLALPAIVEAGDYVLAERFLRDPLERLGELNRLACEFPLLPPAGDAPRLGAELSNFIKDVILLAAVMEGRGRTEDAASLRRAALAGIASDRLRELAQRELDLPGTIIREIVAHQMAQDGSRDAG